MYQNQEDSSCTMIEEAAKKSRNININFNLLEKKKNKKSLSIKKRKKFFGCMTSTANKMQANEAEYELNLYLNLTFQGL